MLLGFQYRGFEPANQITAEANKTLERLQDLGPLESTIIGLLEFDGKNYSCSVDLYTRNGSIYASSSDKDALQALQLVEEKVVEKMRKVKDTRFYSRHPDLLTKKRGRTNDVAEQFCP